MFTAGTDIINDYLNREWVQPVAHPVLIKHSVKADILRLDRIHPLISGNKWLKLDHWLQKFNNGKYLGILTAGGPWSNHLHACAYACFLGKIRMEALVKGRPSLQNAMLDDLKKWNVSLRFIHRDQFYSNQTWEEYAEEKQLLFIPVGGDGPEGVSGVTRWMNQLPLDPYDEIFCPVGTATTLKGIAASNLQFKVLTGTDPGTGDKNLASQIEVLNLNHPDRKIRLLKSGNKFGKLPADLHLFMQQWHLQTGIEPDFVYTAPMFKLFLEMAESHAFAPETRVLLIHTGGLQGNRSIRNPLS